MEPPQIAYRVSAQAAIGNRVECLEESIRQLLAITKSLPEGDNIGIELVDQISGLNSIHDVILEAVEMLVCNK